MTITPTLTPDASGEDVLAMARILSGTWKPRDALERDDFVSIACLAYYTKRDYVTAHAHNFHSLMVWHMDTAILDQTCREAVAHGGIKGARYRERHPLPERHCRCGKSLGTKVVRWMRLCARCQWNVNAESSRRYRERKKVAA